MKGTREGPTTRARASTIAAACESVKAIFRRSPARDPAERRREPLQSTAAPARTRERPLASELVTFPVPPRRRWVYGVPVLTYTPDSPLRGGFAIAAGRRVALLGPEAGLDVALTVHHLLSDPGVPMADALDLVRESTVARQFAFVELASDESRTAKVALRGDVRVDLGSATSRFAWPDGATWVTADAENVALVRLSLGDAPADEPSMPMYGGVVYARDLVVHASAMDVPAEQPAPSLATEDVDDVELTVLMEETVAAAREAAKAREADEARRLAGVAPLTPREVPPAYTQASPQAPRASEAGATPTRPSLAPQRVDLSSLMRPATWTLKLPDGHELDAGSSIVVGRRPWRHDPDETSTYYILAPSPSRQISGKHLEFSVVGDELRARDLESTNGTLLLTHDKPPRLLTDGRSVSLGEGDTLDLGEGFQIVVGERR